MDDHGREYIGPLAVVLTFALVAAIVVYLLARGTTP